MSLAHQQNCYLSDLFIYEVIHRPSLQTTVDLSVEEFMFWFSSAA